MFFSLESQLGVDIFIFVWIIDKMTLSGYFFPSGSRKFSDYKVTRNQRFANKSLQNPADFEAIYLFNVYGCHTTAVEICSLTASEFRRNRTKPELITFFFVNSLHCFTQQRKRRSPIATEKPKDNIDQCFGQKYLVLLPESWKLNENIFIEGDLCTGQFQNSPCPPPPGKPPGIWLFWKLFGQIPRYVASLDGQMPHPLEL